MFTLDFFNYKISGCRPMLISKRYFYVTDVELCDLELLKWFVSSTTWTLKDCFLTNLKVEIICSSQLEAFLNICLSSFLIMMVSLFSLLITLWLQMEYICYRMMELLATLIICTFSYDFLLFPLLFNALCFLQIYSTFACNDSELFI